MVSQSDRDIGRLQLLRLYRAGLAAVDGRASTRSALAAKQPLPGNPHWQVFAVGKAAASMLHGAHDVLGARLARALVVTPAGHGRQSLRALESVDLTVIESAHPVPDDRSLQAGAQLLAAVRQAAPEMALLFLISGGSSALVEVLRAGVDLAALRACNERGLAEGWSIDVLNAKRAELSQIKGGGLSAVLAGREAVALFLSDVPGDDPALIGSGLLGPAPGGDAIRRQIIGSADVARRAVVAAAQADGLRAREVGQRFADDALCVAQRCVEQLRKADEDLLAWAGESTVRLPPNPGRGGRNQHVALAAALHLQGDSRCWLLVAGTDGVDGQTEDAGAIVDGDSAARMDLAQIDAAASLAAADSGGALAAAGDLLHTGPTGTNVGDLIIGLRRPANGWPEAVRHAAAQSRTMV